MGVLHFYGHRIPVAKESTHFDAMLGNKCATLSLVRRWALSDVETFTLQRLVVEPMLGPEVASIVAPLDEESHIVLGEKSEELVAFHMRIMAFGPPLINVFGFTIHLGWIAGGKADKPRTIVGTLLLLEGKQSCYLLQAVLFTHRDEGDIRYGAIVVVTSLHFLQKDAMAVRLHSACPLLFFFDTLDVFLRGKTTLSVFLPCIL